MSRRLVLAATIGTFAVLAAPVAAGAMPDHNCECTTTTASTTTTEVTTTTVASVTTYATTTTVPKETTTSFHEQVVTTTTGSTTSAPPPSSPTSVRMSTTVPGQHLPFTGGSVLFPFLFGLCCVAGGAALLFRRSGSWRSSSTE